MSNTEPIGDRSYGIIPIRLLPSTPATSAPTTSNSQVLLILQMTITSTRCFWTFPKGHAETGDLSLQHTALRELHEETGLIIALEDLLKLGTDEDADGAFIERYQNPVRKVGKEVKYWVGLVRGEQAVKVQEEEIADFKWCTWEEARLAITFDEGRDMLDLVMQKLK